MKLLYFYAGRHYETRDQWMRRDENPEVYDGAYVYMVEGPASGEWHTADHIPAWECRITPEMRLQVLLLT